MKKYLPLIVSLSVFGGCTASQSNQRTGTLEQRTVQDTPASLPEQPKPSKQTGNNNPGLNYSRPSCDSWFSDPSPCCEQCETEYQLSLANCETVKEERSSAQYSACEEKCRAKSQNEESLQKCLEALSLFSGSSGALPIELDYGACTRQAKSVQNSCQHSCGRSN